MYGYRCFHRSVSLAWPFTRCAVFACQRIHKQLIGSVRSGNEVVYCFTSVLFETQTLGVRSYIWTSCLTKYFLCPVDVPPPHTHTYTHAHAHARIHTHGHTHTQTYSRGLIMGVWYTHASLGNILGTIIPSFWADCNGDYPWSWSFLVPAFIIFGLGIVMFLLLVVDPKHVGLFPPRHNTVSVLHE